MACVQIGDDFNPCWWTREESLAGVLAAARDSYLPICSPGTIHAPDICSSTTRAITHREVPIVIEFRRSL